MKIIEPSFEIITETDTLKKIELCGRVCYKSEDKITDNSAEKFVRNLINRGHESVLEHAEIIIKVDKEDAAEFVTICNYIERFKGVRVLLRMSQGYNRIISGNVRMWRDFMRICECNNVSLATFPPLALFRGILFDDLNHLPRTAKTTAEIITADQLINFERDVHTTETVRFVVDRGISHEIVRHRMASYSQESTRYCNYGSKDITFIVPQRAGIEWVNAMMYAEKQYKLMIEKGMTPQEARSVLPNSTKTEIIMTTTRENWRHFFKLRTAAAAHPQMRQITIPLYEELKRRWGDD